MATSVKLTGMHRPLADGHAMQFRGNFTSSLPTSISKFFRFPCHCNSTAWSFRMTFQQASNDSNVGCLVEIIRTDLKVFSMNVEFSMRLYPIPIVQLPPLIYRIEDMQDSDKESRTFDDVIPNEVLKRMDDGELMVHISFEVHGCHQEAVRRDQD